MQLNVSILWLGGEFCIRCDGGSGRLLVCSENGCPVGIHEACMNCEPQFDEMGKFYCPYCWYKRELARTKELRRKAMLAKTKLSDFICIRDGEKEEKQDDEVVIMKGGSVSTMAENLNSGECENGLNDDGDKETIHHGKGETQCVEPVSKETSDEESNFRAHGFDNAGNGEGIEEDSIEDSGDSEDEIVKDQWQIQPYNASHLVIVEGTLHLPTKETADAVGAPEENHGKRGKEKAALPKVSATESFEFVAPDTETLLVLPKHIKHTAQRARFKRTALMAWPISSDSPSFQPSTCAKYMKMNQQGKNIIGKKSVRCQESTNQLIIPTLGTQKRRRLHWTDKEEDMLKEGVRRFSTEVNKNIPWRKILEYGHQVFHTTRTPVDLKDKWKNMMAKDAPKT